MTNATTPTDAVYLASRSPRRQELLTQLGVAFDELKLRTAPGRHRDVIEEALDGEPALHYVERIARSKATMGWKRMQERGLPPRPVLGADTEVVLDDVDLRQAAATSTPRARCSRSCRAVSTTW